MPGLKKIKAMEAMQIDVVLVGESYVTCNLYTENRCVRIYLGLSDYEALMRDGFFIRDGKTRDSANVLNTTKEYHWVKSKID